MNFNDHRFYDGYRGPARPPRRRRTPAPARERDPEDGSPFFFGLTVALVACSPVWVFVAWMLWW